jgi:hypothetical protein
MGKKKGKMHLILMSSDLEYKDDFGWHPLRNPMHGIDINAGVA